MRHDLAVSGMAGLLGLILACAATDLSEPIDTESGTASADTNSDLDATLDGSAPTSTSGQDPGDGTFDTGSAGASDDETGTGADPSDTGTGGEVEEPCPEGALPHPGEDHSCERFVEIGAGETHTCARTDLGRLYCWGYNGNGEVGDGTDEIRTNPTQVGGPMTSWTTLTTGDRHTCGINGGRLYCWGENQFARLGDNSQTDRWLPTEVHGEHADWEQVSAGWAHTCGVRSGRVFCWGNTQNGQVGDGTSNPPSTFQAFRWIPTEVVGGYPDWDAVDAGGGHSCGIRGGGRLFCWGGNGSGTLGNGSFDDTSSPLEVAGAHRDWSILSLGSGHACAGRDGRLFCWGANLWGQLGNGTDGVGGTNAAFELPAEVAGGATDWDAVAASAIHTCGLRMGRLYCWGEGYEGALGNGGGESQLVPGEVAGAHADWHSVAAGHHHTCGIREGGALFCWGDNAYGQIGNSGAIWFDEPVPVLP